MPWHLPEDLAFFQRETTGGAIIMGRNTWDSLPYKPLKKRLNLVVTSNTNLAEHTFTSLQSAIDFAHAAGHRRLYGIGGARIYAELLPIADRLLITEAELEILDADTFFPEFDPSDWHHLGTSELRAADPKCVLHEYLRK